jgi:septal ring factor EnvC (AmiA/AmiB activator)
MNEKKPTDEEIVKALEFAIAQKEADWIGYWNEKYQWIEFPMKDVLELINRLKKGRKTFFRLAKQRYEEKRELENKVEEQKAEIERLTEEKWQAQDDLDNYSAMYQEEVKANAELQKKVDECENRVSAAYELGYKESKLSIVKDTAKEIADWLITTESNKEDLAKIIKEHYGVEVE